MLTQSQFSQIRFIARIDNIKGIYNSLKAINFHDTATFQISDNGLRVIVENSKNLQASVYITKECFTEFHIPPDSLTTFSVSLNVVTDCLSIFSSVECSMKMIYKGEGAPLVLVLEHHGEDDVITECSIKTKRNDEPLDFSINEEDHSFNSVIIRGPDLSNLFNEIDKTADELEIFLSPNAPYFRISTIGVMQSESMVEVAKTSKMMMLFSCKESTTMRYKLSAIRLILKPLVLASKVAIRTDSSGLLSLQLMILHEEAEQIYIEIFIMPLIDFD